MARFDKKIAGILAKYGVVAHEDAEGFVAAAEQAGQSLTEYLINENLAAEPDIIGAVSEEMDLPPIDISRVEVDPKVLELVPEDIALQHQVLPVAKIGRTLTLAVANPFDILSRDDVKMVAGCDLIPVVSTDVSIKKAIQKIYGDGEEAAAAEIQEIVGEMGIEDALELTDTTEEADIGVEAAESDSAPAVKLVKLMIAEAVKSGASGIHIEPYEKRSRVRYRIDGTCVEKMSPPKGLHHAVASRIKILANMDIAERRRPQDGKFAMKFKGRNIDFRVSILPLVYGEKVVIRVLDASAGQADLDTLGLEEQSLADFEDAIHCANGMILVTGPTGSGKTTTLYAAVKKIVRIEDNITTVEDPVEYTMEGVNQVQVNERRGLTFAAALRSILRQDPDKVLIGEIRDKETAEIAVKAALTGHLVLSTLHTNDAPRTVTRLLNMGIDGFLVAGTLILVCSQRLVRRLCPECKKADKVGEEEMREWGFTEQEIAAKPELFMQAGCGRCNNVGYKGRLALMETLRLNEDLREIVSKGGSAVAIKQKALELGMLTLRRVGILNAIRGNTSAQEVLSNTMPDN